MLSSSAKEGVNSRPAFAAAGFYMLGLEFHVCQNAEIAPLFGHDGLETGKVVPYVSIEQIVCAENETVMGEGEFPTDFDYESEYDVARSFLFIFVNEALRERKVAVD